MESLPGSDALLTIAEVLVALAAASGIILALTRDPEPWHAFDAQRVFLLLASSLGGTFLALLPFALHFAGLRQPQIWRAASWAMAVLVLVVAPFGFRLTRAAYAESRESFRLWVTVPMALISLLNLGAQILNGLAIGFGGLISVFFIGLLWFVAFGALLFVLMVFNRPRTAD